MQGRRHRFIRPPGSLAKYRWRPSGDQAPVHIVVPCTRWLKCWLRLAGHQPTRRLERRSPIRDSRYAGRGSGPGSITSGAGSSGSGVGTGTGCAGNLSGSGSGGGSFGSGSAMLYCAASAVKRAPVPRPRRYDRHPVMRGPILVRAIQLRLAGRERARKAALQEARSGPPGGCGKRGENYAIQPI
jgi:hypothetical protein